MLTSILARHVAKNGLEIRRNLSRNWHGIWDWQSWMLTLKPPRIGLIYGVSRTIVVPSLSISLVQITQSYGGDCPANKVDCVTLEILSTGTYNRRFLENQTNKYARHCSGAPRLWLRAQQHCLAYFSVGFPRHRRLYCLFNRICNVCANHTSLKTIVKRKYNNKLPGPINETPMWKAISKKAFSGNNKS